MRLLSLPSEWRWSILKIGMCMDTTQSLNAILPGDAPLPFDATLLFKALQYQLLVAVEYCYDLAPDESLWIEVMGDVTVPGKTQTEVKLYSNSLTDSHANFWNTIKIGFMTILTVPPSKAWCC
ncbi:hypothetical protein NWF32_03245 [Pseudomonas qingdaonensis]|nr:hypothetical protein [Pseudomonas qingdaonensis]